MPTRDPVPGPPGTRCLVRQGWGVNSELTSQGPGWASAPASEASASCKVAAIPPRHPLCRVLFFPSSFCFRGLRGFSCPQLPAFPGQVLALSP